MTGDWLVAVPVLAPLAASVFCLAAWRSLRAQRVIGVVSSVVLAVSAVLLLMETLGGGVPAMRLGGWPAPLAITLVADVFGALMVTANAAVACLAVVYAAGGVDRIREAAGFHPLLHAMIGAVSGAFLTGDIFNLYVWFEVMLMSAFALLALGGTRPQLEGAIKYVALNLLASTLFLAAIGLLYGLVGTLNLADIAQKIAGAENPELATPALALLFMSFGLKAAVFPMFFWLPASYHTPPAVVSVVFAGLLTKVGVYSIIRVSMLITPGDAGTWDGIYEVLAWVAGLTMVSGVLGAAVQTNMRRLLSLHIVSQIGYMLMGVAIAGSAVSAAAGLEAAGDEPGAEALRFAAGLALGGAILHTLHNMLVKGGLLMVAGIIERREGTGDLNEIGGLYKDRPALAASFLVLALALAGIPVLSGFWSKLLLVRGGLEAEAYWIVGVSLAVSVLTLFSMTKIWAMAFWTPRPEGRPDPVPDGDGEGGALGAKAMFASVAAVALLAVAAGPAAGPMTGAMIRAGEDLLDPSAYVAALLDEPVAGDEAAGGDGP